MLHKRLWSTPPKSVCSHLEHLPGGIGNAAPGAGGGNGQKEAQGKLRKAKQNQRLSTLTWK